MNKERLLRKRITELEEQNGKYHQSLTDASSEYLKQRRKIEALEAALNTKDPEQHLKQLLNVTCNLRAEITEFKTVLGEIEAIAEQVTFNEITSYPCGVHDKIMKIDELAKVEI